jgi:hypothetical protein
VCPLKLQCLGFYSNGVNSLSIVSETGNITISIYNIILYNLFNITNQIELCLHVSSSSNQDCLICLEGPKQLQTGNSKENSKQHGRPGYIIGAVIVAVSMVTILVGVSIYYKRKRNLNLFVFCSVL